MHNPRPFSSRQSCGVTCIACFQPTRFLGPWILRLLLCTLSTVVATAAPTCTVVSPTRNVLTPVVVTNVAGAATSNAATLTIATASLTPEPNGFTNNGNPDFLWRNINTGAVAFWRMNGTNLQSTFGVEVTSVSWEIGGTGDFNNDGQTDLLWRKTATSDVAFWRMNGTAM